MSSLPKCWLALLSTLMIVGAKADEQAPTLDLREVKPALVSVSGTQVSLVIIGLPPRTLMFTNTGPRRLGATNKETFKRLRVTYGADLIGFARVLKSEPRGALLNTVLVFQTEDQAVAAEKASRPGGASPSPLPRAKKEKR